MTEVAERLGIGRTTVYQEVVDGNLKAKRFGKKNIRIPAEELRRYGEEQDYYKGTYRWPRFLFVLSKAERGGARCKGTAPTWEIQ